MKTANFKKEAIFNDSKPAISVMLETENTKEIRILMKDGQEMKKHQTAFPIVVHLLSGSIDFEVDGTVHALTEGAILTLESNVPHSLVAKANSEVRLSLSKQDKFSRVEAVIRD